MSPLESYANGMSARQVAKMHSMPYAKLRRMLERVGMNRDHREAAAASKDVLVIELSWATIRSPYVKPQWFSNIDFGGKG